MPLITATFGRLVRILLVAVMALWLAAGTAFAAVPLTQVVTDPFTNPDSQHQTAVEPDTFAFGNTIVSVWQVGRYFDGGASGIGFGTSTNGGATWTSGSLPGLTAPQGGPFARATDPAIAFDAAHGVWLAQALVLDASPSGVGITVNRSTDGINWSGPIMSATPTPAQDFDKNWIVCDNHATSPFFGRCYQTWDDFAAGDRLLQNFSTDGGLTWSAPVPTGNNATGLGGQPVVQPSGTVIIPASNAFETAIIAFRSTNGGVSWGSSVTVATVPSHAVAGSLRTGPLPTAEIDAAGTVYVVWQDCRFRQSCRVNDLVMSTSANGVNWTPVQRIPIDPTTSGIDHFIPGLAVDAATSGATAKLGLTYYFYRNGRCGNRCQLEVGYIQSSDGGANWSSPVDVAAPFRVNWVANTTQGRMVGDYISTSWIGGRAYGAVAVAGRPTGGLFDEDGFVPTGGLTAAAGPFVNNASADQAIVGAASDHAAPPSAVSRR